MWYIKNIKLINFMGYRNVEFNFFNYDGFFKPLVLIFAPNGSGKSSLLNAINLVYNSYNLKSRDSSLLLKKSIYSEDYDPHYQILRIKEGLISECNMLIDATLVNKNTKQEGKVIINNSGVVETCLNDVDSAYFIDADSPINSRSFQIHSKDAKNFLDLSKIIYNFDCEFDQNKFVNINTDESFTLDFVNKFGGDLPEDGYYTDFIINKYGTKVHYKSFSGGEKKIATMLSILCDSEKIDKSSLILIDSFEKEIYFKRQSRAVDKMLEVFNDKQFFIVTHSETLINHVKKKHGEDFLYDIEKYKMKDLGIEFYQN
jgi:ABC-type lipoprotein export system ATPase subunit